MGTITAIIIGGCIGIAAAIISENSSGRLQRFIIKFDDLTKWQKVIAFMIIFALAIAAMIMTYCLLKQKGLLP